MLRCFSCPKKKKKNLQIYYEILFSNPQFTCAEIECEYLKTSISSMYFPPTRWPADFMSVLSGFIQPLSLNIRCFIFSIYVHVCIDSIKWSNKRDVIYNGFLNLFSAITISLNGVNEFRTLLGFCRLKNLITN